MATLQLSALATGLSKGPTPRLHGVALPDSLETLVQEIATDQGRVITRADVPPRIDGAVSEARQASHGGGWTPALGNAISKAHVRQLMKESLSAQTLHRPDGSPQRVGGGRQRVDRHAQVPVEHSVVGAQLPAQDHDLLDLVPVLCRDNRAGRHVLPC